MAEKQEVPRCMGCGLRPATSSRFPIPLCEQCAAIAAQKERGVEYLADKEKT
jgi:hypothetical protein